MKVLKFTLTQHTPLIHFQKDEPGATLRASEVKPKLDKFIIERIGKGAYDTVKSTVKTNHKDWFIDKNDVYALNYKMSITGSNIRIPEIDGYFGYSNKGKPLPAPMFFGNMENKENAGNRINKKCFSKGDKFNLTIICCDSLGDIINNYIHEFFLCHNFGTRQSKGYGSFTVDGKNISLPFPSFTLDSDEKTLFQDLELFYKAIRSGINYKHQNFYMKSFIFAFAKYKNTQWEKKTIKSELYQEISNTRNFADRINEIESDIHPNNESISHNTNNQRGYLFKDCLGLSKTETWNKPYIKDNDIYYVLHGMTLKKRSETEGQNVERVQRMKSPITFKPIKTGNGYKVYMIYHEIPEEFLNTPFYVSFSYKERNGILTTNEIMLTPYPDFSVTEFIDFVFRKMDISTLIDNNNAKNITGKKIIRIFNKLKQEYNNIHKK